MLRSAAHETYHFVENYSAKDAADLRDYVIDSLKENGVDIEKALEKYAKQGPYDTRENQISELVADSMFDVFSNEDFIKNLTAKNQTLAKRLANHIGELVQKIRDAVKMLSVRYSNPEIKALMDDAEKLDTIRNMMLEGYKNAGENFKAEQAKGQKNNADGTAVNSIKNVIDNNGNEHPNTVVLDTNLFKGEKPRNWSKVLVNYIYNNLAGKKIPAYDDAGNEKIFEFAKYNERVKKDGAKNPHRVIDKLATKKDLNSQLAVAHADEIIQVMNYVPPVDEIEINHQWLDSNGWEHYKVHLMQKNGSLFEATINVAQTKDGRNILYDINKIKKIGYGTVSSKSMNTQRDLHISPDLNKNIPQEVKSVKQNFSVKQTDEITKFNMQTAKENRIYRQIFNLLDDTVYTGIKINKIPDPKFIRQQAEEMLKEVGSTYSVNELTEELTVVYEYMSQQAGKNLYKTEDLFPNVLAIARRVVDQCTEKDSSAYDDAKEIRDLIKSQPIYITPNVKAEIISQFGDYSFY